MKTTFFQRCLSGFVYFTLLLQGACSWSSHQLTGNMLKANDNLLSASRLIDAGHPEEAFIVLRSALHQYQLAGNLPLSVQTMNQIASLYSRTQRYPLAILWYKRSLSLATILDNPSLMSDTLALVAQVEWQLGKTEDARKEVIAGIAISMRIKEARNRNEVGSLLYSVKGLVMGQLGQRAVAMNAFKKSYEYSRKIGDQKKMAENMGNIGRLDLLSSDYVQSVTAFKKALSLDKKAQNPDGIAFDSEGLALVYDQLKEYKRSLINLLVAAPIRKLNGPADLYQKDLDLINEIETSRNHKEELIILDRWLSRSKN